MACLLELLHNLISSFILFCLLFGSVLISVGSEKHLSACLMADVLAWLSAAISAEAEADGSVVGTLVWVFSSC